MRPSAASDASGQLFVGAAHQGGDPLHRLAAVAVAQRVDDADLQLVVGLAQRLQQRRVRLGTRNPRQGVAGDVRRFRDRQQFGQVRDGRFACRSSPVDGRRKSGRRAVWAPASPSIIRCSMPARVAGSAAALTTCSARKFKASAESVSFQFWAVWIAAAMRSSAASAASGRGWVGGDERKQHEQDRTGWDHGSCLQNGGRSPRDCSKRWPCRSDRADRPLPVSHRQCIDRARVNHDAGVPKRRSGLFSRCPAGSE